MLFYNNKKKKKHFTIGLSFTHLHTKSDGKVLACLSGATSGSASSPCTLTYEQNELGIVPPTQKLIGNLFYLLSHRSMATKAKVTCSQVKAGSHVASITTKLNPDVVSLQSASLIFLSLILKKRDNCKASSKQW